MSNFTKYENPTYLLTFLLTFSMERNPSWEANRFSASQEIPRIVWNQKVLYCIKKNKNPTTSKKDEGHLLTCHKRTSDKLQM